MTTFYLLILFMLPAVMAVGIAIPRRRELSAQWVGELVIATALLVLGAMLALCRLPVGTVIVSPVVGLSFTFGGFQRLYGLVVCFMWLICAMLSPQYFRGHHHLRRYYFFFLICLSFTLGVFLSADLKTTFLFFELMSLGSYVWVVQEETPEALDAGKTYLTIAVLGGLVTLMGLFLLQHLTGTLVLSELKDACAAVTDRTALWWAALCVFFGFAAKAGLFSVHIWLPKAYPVAPAPASALLSGMLSKAGIFGMLVLTCYLMRGCTAFGDVIFRLGVITMFLGALLAIFSTNLKRTLACSSLSQIGFIMVGVGLQGLSAGENGLAAYGTIQHMVNHSLFKLVLFLCAGVVAMNAHALSLNEVRGFGRKKPLLHFCFLMGMLGIAGIPGFSGYASKSLLHEGLLEYIHELTALGEGALPYQIAEWVFIISGGMTLCYMFKLYLCLFWQKNPTRQAEYDGMRKYLSVPSGIALGLCAALIPVLGLLPGVLMSGIGELARPFFNAAAPAHMPIAYFSGENLLGAAKSIIIGVVLYALNWQFIMSKEKKGSRSYPERWPKWLDLEDLIYRPALRLLIAVGYGVALVLDRLMDGVIVALRAVGGLLARVADGLCDGLILGVRRIFLPPLSARQPVPVGNRFTYAFGRFCDGTSAFITRLFHLHRPSCTRYESVFAAAMEEAGLQFKRLTRSISFGLIMFCLGLFVTLAYLLWL